MISLILISGFLVVAVFLRIIIQYQRTGDHGVRAASKKAPLMEILPGTVFILTFCFALALIVLGYLGSIKLSYEPPILVQLLGFLIGISGVAITVISQFQMGNS